MTSPNRRFCFAIALVLSMEVVQAAEIVDYSRDIRPLLSTHCLGCHGPDAESRKAELRLDRPEDAFRDRGGYSAIVQGDLQQSEVIQRITSNDPEHRMPPQQKEPLSDGEIKTFERWIKAGAKYERHWAFVAPQRPAIPTVKNPSWPRGPLDAFVLARIEAAGLEPSQEAAWQTLVRRVYLDVIGLPPLPEDVEQFRQEAEATSFDAAYERLVDRLLASPHYGERWARRWLDLARYADTNGYEKDRDRDMWPYRDWVVRALNADMPFDQFTIEQIAGDLLPDATIDQRVATGFHRNTMLNEEGGIDPLEYRFHAMTDRVATTGTAWLGLTLGCAQCHSHKYDPFTHFDYYRLMAFLNNADEPELELPDAALDAQHRQNLARADGLVAELHAKWPLDNSTDGGTGPETSELSMRRRFDEWLASMRRKIARWTTLRPIRGASNSPLLTIQDDDSVFASGDTTKRDTYQVTFRGPLQGVTAIRLEALPDKRLPGRGPGMTYYEGSKGDFFLGEFRLVADGKAVPIHRATHSYAKNQFGAERPVAAPLTIDGDPQTGWSVYGREGERQVVVYRLETPLAELDELQLTMEFGRHFASSLGCFRLSTTTDSNDVQAVDLATDVERLLLKPDGDLTSTERRALWEEFLLRDSENEPASAKIRELRQRPAYAMALVMRERPPSNRRTTQRHHRGEYLQPAEEVEPRTPPALHAFPADWPRNRLGFARWLVSPQNPLAARVVVNRQWADLFGRGIVETIDDFGTQGSPPTHPQLLDWLAIEFVKRGWSLKWLHRTIVTSSTYRQSSSISPESIENDPDDRLLARAPRPRLSAERIRDVILHAGGLLSLKIGGPPVFPPQPSGVMEAAWGDAKWIASEGADRYRRSIYTYRKRTAPFAMYETFDAPSGESCTANRDVSNTPLQALTLVNDLMLLEAAQSMGQVLSAYDGDDQGRVGYAFRRVLARPPDKDEIALFVKFAKRQRSRFSSGELDAATVAGDSEPEAVERAVWTTVARTLFSLDELVTRN